MPQPGTACLEDIHLFHKAIQVASLCALSYGDIKWASPMRLYLPESLGAALARLKQAICSEWPMTTQAGANL